MLTCRKCGGWFSGQFACNSGSLDKRSVLTRVCDVKALLICCELLFNDDSIISNGRCEAC